MKDREESGGKSKWRGNDKEQKHTKGERADVKPKERWRDKRVERGSKGIDRRWRD